MLFTFPSPGSEGRKERPCNAALMSQAWHHRTRMVEEKVFSTCPLDLTVNILLHVTGVKLTLTNTSSSRCCVTASIKPVQDPVLKSMKVPLKSAWHNKVKDGEHLASCLPIAQGRSMSVSFFDSAVRNKVCFLFFQGIIFSVFFLL